MGNFDLLLYSPSTYNYLYSLHLGLRTFINYKTSVEIKIKTKKQQQKKRVCISCPVNRFKQILDYNGVWGKMFLGLRNFVLPYCLLSSGDLRSEAIRCYQEQERMNLRSPEDLMWHTELFHNESHDACSSLYAYFSQMPGKPSQTTVRCKNKCCHHFKEQTMCLWG